MADENMDAGPSNSSEFSVEQTLDLASENFDPIRVLYGSDISRVDNVEVYDSVSQFTENVRVPSIQVKEESNKLKTETEIESKPSENITDTKTVQSQDMSVEKPKLPLTDKPKRTIFCPQKNNRSVLTEMETNFSHGPLSILARSVAERLKVRVWTRSVRNIRGVSTGYIVAFDKHMNLAMVDVDEVYRKPVGKHQKKPKSQKVESIPAAESSQESEEEKELQYPKAPWQHVSAGALEDAELCGSSGVRDEHEKRPPADGIGDLTSAFKGMHVFQESEATRLLGTKTCKLLCRHLNQVFLRGDHVVSVALVDCHQG